jgi:hypothetical protein
MSASVSESCGHATPCQRKGGILSKELAVEIYKRNIVHADGSGQSTNSSSESKLLGRSSVVASMYNISPKTVRDIWNRVTWKHATCHLWTEGEIAGSKSSPITYVREEHTCKIPDRECRVVSHNKQQKIRDQYCQNDYGDEVYHLHISHELIPQVEYFDSSGNRDNQSSLISASVSETFPSVNVPCSNGDFFASADLISQNSADVPLTSPLFSTLDSEMDFPSGEEDDPFHWDWTFW